MGEELEELRRQLEEKQSHTQKTCAGFLTHSQADLSSLASQSTCAAAEARELRGIVEEWRSCELCWTLQIDEGKREVERQRRQVRELDQELLHVREQLQRYCSPCDNAVPRSSVFPSQNHFADGQSACILMKRLGFHHHDCQSNCSTS